MHCTQCTVPKTACLQPFFYQYGEGSSLEAPPAHSHSTHSIMFATLIFVAAKGEEGLGRLVWIWGLLDKVNIEILLARWLDSGS